jgi:hypothetical protein
MKIAIVLSGLPRKVREGYEQYWKFIIDRYDVDLYVHAWKDEEWEVVKEVYSNAKVLDIQEPFSFKEYTENITADDNLSRPTLPYEVAGNFRGLPMFYSWQRISNQVKGDYDFIIRSRFDLTTNTPLELEKLEKGKIYVSAHHWGGNQEIHDDNLLVTDQNIFETFFKDCFDELIRELNDSGHMNFQEKMFGKILKRKQLFDKVVKSQYLNFQLLRENKLWY